MNRLQLLLQRLVLSLCLVSAAKAAMAAPGSAVMQPRDPTPAHTPTPNTNLNPFHRTAHTSDSGNSEIKSKRQEPLSPSASTTANPGAFVDRLLDFQQYRFGVPPPDFDYDGAGPVGAPSLLARPSWRAYVDLSAPSPKMVLIRSPAMARTEPYPVAMLRNLAVDNVNLAVSFKLLDDETTRSAGLLWRAQGANDYRSLLVSSAHRQIRLLKMENGTATELAKATVTFEEKEWNFLEVSVRGDRVAVWLNERSALNAHDTQPAKPGRVGLIAGADTVALFDDFHVQNAGERIVRKKYPKAEVPSEPVLRVTEILTTHLDFKTPCRSFQTGGQARWRVHVADEHQKPAPAVIVECQLVGPDGNVFDRDKGMTGTDGFAFFTRTLPKGAPAGTYSVRVKSITHADMPEASCSSLANMNSTATFEVRR